MDKNNEFKKLLSEMEISVDDILNEKSLYDNTSQKKEFTPVSIKQEELEDEMHDDVLEFKNQGVQQGILNKLKRIKRDYDFKEGRIDLHGENIQTAQLKINNHSKMSSLFWTPGQHIVAHCTMPRGPTLKWIPNKDRSHVCHWVATI